MPSPPRVVIERRSQIAITDPVFEAMRCRVCSKRLDAVSLQQKYCSTRCNRRASALKRRGLLPDGKWVNAKLNPKSKNSRAVPEGR